MSTHAVHIEVAGKWLALAITKQRFTRVGSDSAQSTSTARLPAGLTKAQKRDACRALARAVSTHCMHSHDCCGHWYKSASTSYTGRRVSIQWHHSRNI